MGGRGGASGLSEPQGRRMSMRRFLENLEKNSRDGMLDALQSASFDVIHPANFTVNGNAVRSQAADFEVGENRVSVRFINQWEPTQVGKPSRPIKQEIEIVSYKNGNATAVRTLAEKKSTSLKNAEKNYREMLEQWKKLTKQKEIRFR